MSGEAFSTKVTVTDDGTYLIFTIATTVGISASAQNYNTITEGDGGAAAIGCTTPATFSGGAGPILDLQFNGVTITPIYGTGDVSVVDPSGTGAYAQFAAPTSQVIGFLGQEILYAPAALAGAPYTAKFASDPGALTMGECYVYGAVYPQLIKTT